MYDAKNKSILISNFQKGIAKSAVLGFEHMRNVEIFDDPGMLKLALKTYAYFTVDGMPVAHEVDLYGNEYVLVSGEGNPWRLYKNGVSIANGTDTAWDMKIWNDYLFVTLSSGVINVYGPLSSSGATMFTSWKTGLASYYMLQMVIRRDGLFMYITNGNRIASLSSFVAGAVGVAPTATLDTGATTLPPYKYATCMVELRNYIFIGTQAGSNWYNRKNFKVGDVLSWDKSTGGTLTNAVALNENGIHALVTDGNRVYVVAGVMGSIYVTDSVNYTLIKKIPWSPRRKPLQTINGIYPNAVGFNHNSHLLIGTSSNTGENQHHGVWEIDTAGGYETVLKHTISSGQVGVNQPLTIGLVKSTSQDTTLIGWQDGSSFGFDKTETNKASDYSAFVESELMQVGSRLNKTTFQNIEFSLARPLQSGQGIQVRYRKDLEEAYTLIGTWDYATIGAVSNYIDKALIADAEKLQIKIELTQPTTAPATANVELITLRIW